MRLLQTRHLNHLIGFSECPLPRRRIQLEDCRSLAPETPPLVLGRGSFVWIRKQKYPEWGWIPVSPAQYGWCEVERLTLCPIQNCLHFDICVRFSISIGLSFYIGSLFSVFVLLGSPFCLLYFPPGFMLSFLNLETRFTLFPHSTFFHISPLAGFRVMQIKTFWVLRNLIEQFQFGSRLIDLEMYQSRSRMVYWWF